MNNLSTYIFQILDPLIAIIVGVLSFKALQSSSNCEVAKTRILKAYHPIFWAAEPYLYQKISFHDAKKFIKVFNKINSKQSVYIYPSLRHFVSLLEKSKNETILNEYWIQICDYISRDYDKLCQQAHLPIRSPAYRLNRKQYKSRYTMIFYTIRLLFPYLILYFVIVYIAYRAMVLAA